MKKLIILLAYFLLIIAGCKENKGEINKEAIIGDIKQTIIVENGITYKIFTNKNINSFKAILVVGSGNNENNPTEGSLDGAAETALCQKAANNGYAAAIVKYRKTPGTADWNTSAKMIGEDYDKVITSIATNYNLAKSKSVVAGFSYSTYLLLTNIAYQDNLKYAKGLLAACGSTDFDKINKFKIPVFSISGRDEFEAYTDPVNSGNNNYAGVGLYNKIPANSAIKVKSQGFSDPNSTGHCAGNWTDIMYNKMVDWLQ